MFPSEAISEAISKILMECLERSSQIGSGWLKQRSRRDEEQGSHIYAADRLKMSIHLGTDLTTRSLASKRNSGTTDNRHKMLEITQKNWCCSNGGRLHSLNKQCGKGPRLLIKSPLRHRVAEFLLLTLRLPVSFVVSAPVTAWLKCHHPKVCQITRSKSINCRKTIRKFSLACVI